MSDLRGEYFDPEARRHFAPAIKARAGHRERRRTGADINNPSVVGNVLCGLWQGEINTLHVDRKYASELGLYSLQYRLARNFHPGVGNHDILLSKILSGH